MILKLKRKPICMVDVFDANWKMPASEHFDDTKGGYRCLFCTQNFSSNAEQCYLDFLEQYTELSSRLPNTQIASYLGITTQFLSKIRNQKTRIKS